MGGDEPEQDWSMYEKATLECHHGGGGTVLVEEYAAQLLRHPVLLERSVPGTCRKRRAYKIVAKALKTNSNVVKVWHKQFISTFHRWMQRLARQGEPPRRLLRRLPRWLRRVEARLRALESARAPRSPADVLQLMVAGCRRHGVLCSAAMLRELRAQLGARAPKGQLHATWVAAQRLALRQLAEHAQRGDAAQHAPGAAARAVADLVLLHTDVAELRLLSDDSTGLFPELPALAALARLAARHGVERRRGRALARRWAGVVREYAADGRLASAVVLQRRWHELKLQTRRRLLARAARRRDAPAPHALHVDVARRFPHVLLQPMRSWRQLVADRLVWDPHDESSRIECDESDSGAPDDGQDDDVQIVEKRMETIDVESATEASAEDDTDDTRDTVRDDKTPRRPDLMGTDTTVTPDAVHREAGGRDGGEEDKERRDGVDIKTEASERSDAVRLLNSLDPARVHKQIIFDSDSGDEPLGSLAPGFASRITFADDDGSDGASAERLPLLYRRRRNKKYLPKFVRKRSIFSCIVHGAAESDREPPAALDPKLVMDTRVKLVDIKNTSGDCTKCCDEGSHHARCENQIAEKISDNGADSGQNANLTNVAHSSIIESAILKAFNRLHENLDTNASTQANVATIEINVPKMTDGDHFESGVSRETAGSKDQNSDGAVDTAENEPDKDLKSYIEIEIAPIAKQESGIAEGGETAQGARETSRSGDAAAPSEGRAESSGEDGSSSPPADRDSACADSSSEDEGGSAAAAAAEPREGGSRVAKRVELPDIAEVRRVNSGLLTAQVAPIPAGGGAAPEAPDALEDTIASRGKLKRLLDKLTVELRLREGVGAPRYCCLARQHRCVNDARRHVSPLAPELQLHRHPAGACTCCCRHLIERDSEREQLDAALAALDRDLRKLIRRTPQPPHGSSKNGNKHARASKKGNAGGDSQQAGDVPRGARRAPAREGDAPRNGGGEDRDDEPGRRRRRRAAAAGGPQRAAPAQPAPDDHGRAEWERQKAVNSHLFALSGAAPAAAPAPPAECEAFTGPDGRRVFVLKALLTAARGGALAPGPPRKVLRLRRAAPPPAEAPAPAADAEASAERDSDVEIVDVVKPLARPKYKFKLEKFPLFGGDERGGAAPPGERRRTFAVEDLLVFRRDDGGGDGAD